MRSDSQLRVFNAEVTASPGIAPPPRPHSWPIVLVLLFGTFGRVVFGAVPLSPFVTLAGQGQGRTRQCLPAVWTFLICPWTFLLPQHRPWARYEMGRGCQALRPDNNPSKSCCLDTRMEMRVLMSWGPLMACQVLSFVSARAFSLA